MMRAEQGFTLVELLAALAAGSLLLVALGAFVGGIEHQDQTLARTDDFDQIAAAAPLLEELLSHSLSDGSRVSTFEGDDRHIETDAEPPLSRASGGPIRLRLDVRRDQAGENLDLELSGSRGIAPDWAERRTLVRGMRSISFDISSDSDAGGADLPRLVSLSFDTNSGAHWDIVVEPRLRGAAGCTFDPISLQCRS